MYRKTVGVANGRIAEFRGNALNFCTQTSGFSRRRDSELSAQKHRDRTGLVAQEIACLPRLRQGLNGDVAI